MARIYQVVVNDKTRKSGLRIIHVNVKGQDNAITKAKKYQDKNPDKIVGVIETKTIRIFRPKK